MCLSHALIVFVLKACDQWNPCGIAAVLGILDGKEESVRCVLTVRRVMWIGVEEGEWVGVEEGDVGRCGRGG